MFIAEHRIPVNGITRLGLISSPCVHIGIGDAVGPVVAADALTYDRPLIQVLIGRGPLLTAAVPFKIGRKISFTIIFFQTSTIIKVTVHREDGYLVADGHRAVVFQSDIGAACLLFHRHRRVGRDNDGLGHGILNGLLHALFLGPCLPEGLLRGELQIDRLFDHFPDTELCLRTDGLAEAVILLVGDGVMKGCGVGIGERYRHLRLFPGDVLRVAD